MTTDLAAQPVVETLASRLSARARVDPDKVFLHTPGQTVSYRDADRRVDALAAGFQAQGIGERDRVVLLMQNSAEHVLVWLALNRIGAVNVPLNPELTADLVRRSMELVAPVAVVSDAPRAPLLHEAVGSALEEMSVLVHDAGQNQAWCSVVPSARPLRDVAAADAPRAISPGPLDAATMLFTSGSTGVPKACVLSHHYLLRTGEIHAKYLRLRADDVLFTPFPLFHIDAATLTVGAALAAGATAALVERFSASQFWSQVRQSGATVFNYMGATANILWKQPRSALDRAHRVRLAWGVPMPACGPFWEERFGFPLVEVYGLTDAGVPAYQPLDRPRIEGSCGRIIPEYDVRIADEAGRTLPAGAVGEILIRSSDPGLLMSEYFAMPDATAHAFRGGWFHTGDTGRLDEAGNLYFVARSREIIRRRGENVAASDVEAGVDSHPEVLESAAVGALSELSEDDIRVFVVAQPGADLAPEDVHAHCRQVLPRHMVPRYIDIVEDLPKTPTEKIERFRLAARPLEADTWDADSTRRDPR